MHPPSRGRWPLCRAGNCRPKKTRSGVHTTRDVARADQTVASRAASGARAGAAPRAPRSAAAAIQCAGAGCSSSSACISKSGSSGDAPRSSCCSMRARSSSPVQLGDDDRRDAVADQVGEGARLRHEAVDAEDQRQPGDRHVADRRQRRGEHDEAAAGDAGRALRGQQQHGEQRDLLHQRQRRVGRLGDEHRGHREVDRRAVEVERVAGRDDEADDRLAHAEVLHLGDHPRQHRLRRRRAEHDQELFLDVADELPDREAVEARDRAEHDEDEDQARRGRTCPSACRARAASPGRTCRS